MANIKVTIDYPISDGTKLKFRTPCESTEVENLIVRYPLKDGIGYAIKTFRFVDAHGKELSGVGNVFTSDVMIELILDVTKGRAFIQNADTNSYIEDIKLTLKRIEEERSEIFAKTGKALEECDEATKNAEGAVKSLNLSVEEIRSGGFVEALRETNDGKRFTFWVGTEEEYKQTPEKAVNCFYLITDDSSIKVKFDQIDTELDNLKGITLYEGETTSAVELPNVDLRQFTRFVVYAKVGNVSGDTGEKKIITFNMLHNGVDTDSMFSVEAYATEYKAEEYFVYKLGVSSQVLSDNETISRATFDVIRGPSDVEGFTVSMYKLVGFRY